MKALVVYSSRTGNTRIIAEAIFDSIGFEKEIYPVEEAPSPEGYDFIAVGFWVNRGKPDEKSGKYMKQIKGKKVGIFATLGAYPTSKHARKALESARTLLKENEILAEFICQGKIDPAILKRMPKNRAHEMNPYRKKMLEEAAKHPNETDCLYAQAAFKDVLDDLVERT